MTSRRKEARKGMPNKPTIKNWWCANRPDVVLLKFDSLDEFMENDYCMACGMIHPRGATERAHILALCEGGGNGPDNLHLLCAACHKDSELYSGAKYWQWFCDRTALHGILSQGMRGAADVGGKLAGLMTASRSSALDTLEPAGKALLAAVYGLGPEDFDKVPKRSPEGLPSEAPKGEEPEQ